MQNNQKNLMTNLRVSLGFHLLSFSLEAILFPLMPFFSGVLGLLLFLVVSPYHCVHETVMVTAAARGRDDRWCGWADGRDFGHRQPQWGQLRRRSDVRRAENRDFRFRIRVRQEMPNQSDFIILILWKVHLSRRKTSFGDEKRSLRKPKIKVLLFIIFRPFSTWVY